MERLILRYFPSIEHEDATLLTAAEEFSYETCEIHKIEGDNTNMPRVRRAVETAKWINYRANVATIKTWYRLFMFICLASIVCYTQPQSLIGIILAIPVLFLIMPYPMSRNEIRNVIIATMLHNVRHKDYCNSTKECNLAIKHWLSENMRNEYQTMNTILDALDRNQKCGGKLWRTYQHVRVASQSEDYNAEQKYLSFVQRFGGFTSDECWEQVIENFKLEVLKHKNTIEIYYVREYIEQLHERTLADIQTHEVLIERRREANAKTVVSIKSLEWSD